jgi:5-methylcytosine-specific restriction endonuclease McrA
VAKNKKTDAQVSSTRTQHPAAEATVRGRKTPAASASLESEVTLNRRAADDRRTASDRRKTGHPVALERRNLQRRVKVSRRRQIDPTTCERDYTIEEIEFMAALDAYKRSSGRMFPTCSEILEVASPPPSPPTLEPAAPHGSLESPQPGLAP